MMFHRLGRRLRIRVIPCCVRVFLAVYQYRVVPRHPLPGAVGTRRTGPQKRPVYSLFREINIPLDGLNLVAFSNCLSVPNSFCHIRPSNRFSRLQRPDALANAKLKKRHAAVGAACLYLYTTNLLEMGSRRCDSSRTSYSYSQTTRSQATASTTALVFSGSGRFRSSASSFGFGGPIFFS